MNIRKVARQEKKYLLNAEQSLKIEMVMGQLLEEDSHNGPQGYMVRSLYFDSLDDRDLFEKLSGIETRRKIRLRIYNPEDEFAFLEMKQKQGSNQMKRSIRIARRDVEQIMTGDYRCLLDYEEDFPAECYGLMTMNTYRPKVIVEYRRKAFIRPENSIRVTFDSRVCATEICSAFYDRMPHYSPVLTPTATVLEVKYDHFLLSYIKEVLNGCDKSEMAVSKYLLARQQKIKF